MIELSGDLSSLRTGAGGFLPVALVFIAAEYLYARRTRQGQP